MKVLVTGASGFIGSALTKRLLAHGENDLRCFVRRLPDDAVRSELAEQHPDAQIEYCVGDLRSRTDAERAVRDVEIVYHLASGMKGSAADIMMNTVVGSNNLLNVLVRCGNPRVVLVSSFAVYGTGDLPAGTEVNEATPLERRPGERGIYSFAKLRQEQLFHEYHERSGIPVVIVRPGVVYGPGGDPLSRRLGIGLPGAFLYFGRNNVLPLTFVDNCAEAIVVVGKSEASWGNVYNIVDDDLPTAKQYFRAYRRQVKNLRYVPVPYWLAQCMALGIERYHRHSKGMLPRFLTRYAAASLWKGNTFSNERLKRIGWRQLVDTTEGLERTFRSFRQAASARAS